MDHVFVAGVYDQYDSDYCWRPFGASSTYTGALRLVAREIRKHLSYGVDPEGMRELYEFRVRRLPFAG